MDGVPQRERHTQARLEELERLAAQEVTVTVRVTVREQGQAAEAVAVTYYSRCSRAQADELVRQLDAQIRTDVR